MHLLMKSDGVSRPDVQARLAGVRRLLEEDVEPQKAAGNRGLQRESLRELADQVDLTYYEALGIPTIHESCFSDVRSAHAGWVTQARIATQDNFPTTDMYRPGHAALHEIAERLTAINNYLGAALRFADTKLLREPELSNHKAILERAWNQVALTSAPVSELRWLLADRVPASDLTA